MKYVYYQSIPDRKIKKIHKVPCESNEKDCEISQKILEARNRVDISLTEYEALKDRVNKAESQVRFLKSILAKLKLPLDDENFKPYDVQTKCLKEQVTNYCEYIVCFKIREDFYL